jgi:serine/threonine-protein kinase
MMTKDFLTALKVAAFALAGVTAATSLVQAEDAYRTYHNDRFGVSADVPRDWRAGRPPENGDGLQFTSPDGTATITVSGSYRIADSVAEALNSEQAPDEGETVTYQTRGPRMAVVSGMRGQTIFYRKVVLSCKDQVMNRVSIEYPLARKQQFDALVSHVAASLHGVEAGPCN